MANWCSSSNDLGAWLVSALEDARYTKLKMFVLGDWHEQALWYACQAGLTATAVELCSGAQGLQMSVPTGTAAISSPITNEREIHLGRYRA
jgi:hypothetical protein